MKYSQPIGIVAVVLLWVSCYLPWSIIHELNASLSGVNGRVSADLYLGKPLTLFTILGVVQIAFFIIPKIWAKRVNFFIGAVVMAYAIYNYLLFSTCREGICPDKQTGIYLMLLFAALAMSMTFFPKLNISGKKK